MSNVVVTPIRDEYIEPIEDAINEGLEMLGLDATAAPAAVIEKMHSYVDELLATDDPPADDMPSIRLGALWGHTVVRQYSWRWVGVEWDDAVADEPAICVVSPDDWYCIPPLILVDRIISRHNINHLTGQNENTIASLFDSLDGIEENPPADKYQILA